MSNKKNPRKTKDLVDKCRDEIDDLRTEVERVRGDLQTQGEQIEDLLDRIRALEATEKQ
jgi:chromosome segregation ATPase